jgi:hypothetical protein
VSECRCGKPTRDDAYVCEDCCDELHRALGDVPWLDDQLEVTITGQKGVDYRKGGGGKGAGELPSPVHWGASEARTHLNALLVSWVLFCDAESIRNQSHHVGLPDDNLKALSGWLIWRIDGLALHDIGPEAVDEITSGVAHCRRLVDRPADRQYLGDCEQQDCTGRMYSKPGSDFARCDACDTNVNAEAIRTTLLAKLDDRLCTAAEIARLSTYLGLKAGRDQVRNRINQWHSRKLITSESLFEDEPAFKFGTVYARLISAEYATRKVG